MCNVYDHSNIFTLVPKQNFTQMKINIMDITMDNIMVLNGSGYVCIVVKTIHNVKEYFARRLSWSFDFIFQIVKKDTFYLLSGHLGGFWAVALTRLTSAGNIPLPTGEELSRCPSLTTWRRDALLSAQPEKTTYSPGIRFSNFRGPSKPSLIEKTLAANIRSDSVKKKKKEK
jgi:hypothetical protein